MESSTVRVRPLRFAFLVNPNDEASVLSVFQANSALWGGAYNFIIPLFKQVPPRYRQQYLKSGPAKEMLNGLVDAFQPDCLVETAPGQAAAFGIEFPPKRIIQLADLTARDDRNRIRVGIDLRSICDDLYDSTFRFVQRHPPSVVLPECSDPKYKLFFAAVFGSLPETGPTADVSDVYLKALDGKRETVKPDAFPDLFNQKYIYPHRLSCHKLETIKNSYSIDSKLFYMDERSASDLIDFWNLRAIGWVIRPLPARLAPKLIDYVEKFIADSYRPFPPPSNAFHRASLLCAKSQSFEDMRTFVGTLKRPGNDAITIDPRVPRIWEEWGRSADHAEPQTVKHKEESVTARVIGQGFHVSAAKTDFMEHDRFSAEFFAFANVLETVEGGTPVIPWKKNVAASLNRNFGEEKTWISREGIVIFSGPYSSSAYLRLPNALNIFSAVAKASGYELTMSSAGRTCEQIISAVGGLNLLGMVARSAELLKLLDRMAHEDVEVEPDIEEGEEQRRRPLSKPYQTYNTVRAVIHRANRDLEHAADSHLGALIRQNVLKFGMALKCRECTHSSWYSIESLALKLNCPRCSSEFWFPADNPPGQNAWAYRVAGPFAAGHFAQGAYCVASALHFLTNQVARQSTWLPSFEMKNAADDCFEPDFGLFAAPNRWSQVSSPYLMLGECKSFNRFEAKDFARARHMAKVFPGSVICFCTFNDSLNADEIEGIKKIAQEGRERLGDGKQLNPVLVLTGLELFGQFSIGEFYSKYGDKADYANHAHMRGDMQELCDFSLQFHLGMESYHKWWEAKNKKRIVRIQAAKKAAKTRKAKSK
jgi:hypothetical protein